MKSIRERGIAILALAFLCCLFLLMGGASNQAAEAKKKTWLIGISQPNSTHPYRRAETTVITQWDAAHDNVQCIITAAQLSSERQIADIENLMARGADLLMVCPHQSDAVVSATQRVRAAGVPIFAFERWLSNDDAMCTIISDQYESGRLAAEYAVKILNGKGNVVIIEGTPGAAQTIDRQRAFMDVFKKHPGIKIVADQVAMYQREYAMTVMENILQANPKIDLVITHDDEMTFGALRAIEAAGRKDEIKLVSVSGSRVGVEAVMKGDFEFTSALSIGFPLALELAVDYLENGKVPPKKVVTPVVGVTKENAAQIYKLFEPGAEFLSSDYVAALEKMKEKK
ncbi:MAG: substrate-binding domain-containing protein [Clostridia bacterium]